MNPLAIANDLQYHNSMYVCICNSVNEKQVNSALADGAASVRELFCKLECKPVCGQCVPMLRDACETGAAAFS